MVLTADQWIEKYYRCFLSSLLFIILLYEREKLYNKEIQCFLINRNRSAYYIGYFASFCETQNKFKIPFPTTNEPQKTARGIKCVSWRENIYLLYASQTKQIYTVILSYCVCVCVWGGGGNRFCAQRHPHLLQWSKTFN